MDSSLKRVAVGCADDGERAGLQRMLRQAGYRAVSVAGDGRSLLSLARTTGPQVVLADVDLPLLSGLDAASAVVHESLAAVILLASATALPLASQAAAAGCSAVLVKPVSERRLVAAIEVAHGRFLAIASLRSQLAALRAEADGTRALRQAVAAVVADAGVSHAEAQERIRRLAAKSNRSLEDTAAAIALARQVRALS